MAISSIATNTQSNAAAVNIRSTLDKLQTSSTRLSSGQQITRASDDAAGLSIGSGLATDQTTLTAALKTSSQAISIINIADSGLGNIASVLSRMKALASQSNSGAMGPNELGYLNTEMTQLAAQIDTLVDTTTFNGSKLLDGTYTAKDFQIGTLVTDVITIAFNAADSTTLGVNGLDLTAVGGVAAANTALDTAIDTIKSLRATAGALQSRFGYASANLETSINNLGAAKSIYLDADFATVSTDFALQQTQLQAGIATLAQTNNLPANLLKLIS